MNIKNILLKTCLIIVLICISIQVQAQTSTSSNPAAGFDMTGFPLWVKDLRRGEIVAFGSFPFTFFFTSLVMDTYRSATHNWDMRYAPWPVKAAGAVDMTSNEQMLTIGIAAGSAVVIAVVDHFIMRSKRNRQQQHIQSLAPAAPIIIRRSLNEPEAAAEEAPVQQPDLNTDDPQR